jgi:hypothetical protein
MLDDKDARTTLTEERFLAHKDAIQADIAKYQIKVKRQLVKHLLSEPTFGTDNQDATSGSESEKMDLSILDRATTIFKCCSSWCKTLLPYPAIFEHDHVKGFGTVSPLALARLLPGANIKRTAALLLKALELSEDTSIAALDDLNGRLICQCENPTSRKPTDFYSLVS